MSLKRKFFWIFFCGVLLLVSLGIFANLYILTNNEQITDIIKLKEAEIVMVFGGGMNDENIQTPMQADRVKKGIEIYKAGKAKKIMLTGDDGANRDDEVSAMHAQALAAGVLESDILIDKHGYRTYLSCRRAAVEHGLNEVIAVSQKFHLSRIIYLCENFGIDVVGVPADLRDYGADGVKVKLREVLARVKAVIEVSVGKL